MTPYPTKPETAPSIIMILFTNIRNSALKSILLHFGLIFLQNLAEVIIAGGTGGAVGQPLAAALLLNVLTVRTAA